MSSFPTIPGTSFCSLSIVTGYICSDIRNSFIGNVGEDGVFRKRMFLRGQEGVSWNSKLIAVLFDLTCAITVIRMRW